MDGAKSLYFALAAEFRSNANAEIAGLNRRWFKNDDFCSYGLSARSWKKIAHRYRESILRLSINERLILVEKLIHSGFQEEARTANWALQISKKSLDRSILPFLDHYLDNAHSWATVDDFCTHVLQAFLLAYRDEVLAMLKQWSLSNSRWKRRASVVAFVRRIGASGKFTRDGLRLCETLIWDTDDLVQKGVGWALKDMMRGDKEAVLQYVRDLRNRSVPSTITLYAIRDLKGSERKNFLKGAA